MGLRLIGYNKQPLLYPTHNSNDKRLPLGSRFLSRTIMFHVKHQYLPGINAVPIFPHRVKTTLTNHTFDGLSTALITDLKLL